VELNSNSLFLSNTIDGTQLNSKSEANEFSFELQNKDADKPSDEKAGKPAAAKGNSAGQQTRQNLQLGNGFNIEALNNDINAQKQAGQQGQQGQFQQLGRGRMSKPGQMVDGPGPGGVPGLQDPSSQNRGYVAPNTSYFDSQQAGQQGQVGQPGRGSQQSLWMANPVNPQGAGGFGGGINGQQGGQGGFGGQMGGQFGNGFWHSTRCIWKRD